MRSQPPGNSVSMRYSMALGTAKAERLRVAVNLLRVSDGVSMWTESLDMRAGDMFAIQDQLADQIASRLRVELAPVRTGPARRGTESAEAYEPVLEGPLLLWSARIYGAGAHELRHRDDPL